MEKAIFSRRCSVIGTIWPRTTRKRPEMKNRYPFLTSRQVVFSSFCKRGVFRRCVQELGVILQLFLQKLRLDFDLILIVDL